MNFLTKISVHLHALEVKVNLIKTEQDKDNVMKEIQALRKNVGNYKRAKEAISCGSLHSEETLEQSKKELSDIGSADNLFKPILKV